MMPCHASLLPLPAGVEFDIWDIATSTLADGTEVAALGWISAPDVRHLRVNAWDLAKGEWQQVASISYCFRLLPAVRH